MTTWSPEKQIPKLLIQLQLLSVGQSKRGERKKISVNQQKIKTIQIFDSQCQKMRFHRQLVSFMPCICTFPTITFVPLFFLSTSSVVASKQDTLRSEKKNSRFVIWYKAAVSVAWKRELNEKKNKRQNFKCQIYSALHLINEDWINWHLSFIHLFIHSWQATKESVSETTDLIWRAIRYSLKWIYIYMLSRNYTACNSPLWNEKLSLL